ncbi:MAG: 30S ribosomal protein S17 [Candidatus Omnitrophota bacterium]
MGKRRQLTGEVTSDKMQKTVVVRVMQINKHSKYSRVGRSYNKYKVHDEAGAARIGDTVRIEETRPLSKDKRFRVIEVVKKAPSVEKIAVKEEI